MIETIYKHFIEKKRKICTDTRNIVPDSIFFALKGENFNGNKFAAEAIKQGARLAIIDEPAYSTQNTILVEDTLQTLQILANYYRNQSTFKVLALTGTNGKTTTKELIKSVLQTKYRCSATSGNLNNHIGVPITILSTPQDAEFLIVEMGANHQGEIAELCKIAEPDCGLITNIGKAHLEGFGGFEGVIMAKSEMYNYLKPNNKLIFYNSTDDLLSNLLSGYTQTEAYAGKESVCSSEKIHFSDHLELEIRLENTVLNINTNLFGKYNVINILAAIKIGNYFQVETPQIINAIENYSPDNNRSQIKKTLTNTLIMDSYNANPSSMESALGSFNEISANNKIVILGEMKELGESSITEHNTLIDRVAKMNLSKCYFVGGEFLSTSNSNQLIFRNTEELIRELQQNKINNSLIFIKGSRANKLELVENYL